MGGERVTPCTHSQPADRSPRVESVRKLCGTRLARETFPRRTNPRLWPGGTLSCDTALFPAWMRLALKTTEH